MHAIADGNGTVAEAPTTGSRKFRVQLDFEAADMATINQLVTELNLGTRAELFRSGLRAIRWMVKKRREGCAVVAISPEERYFEPEFDFLDAIPSPLIHEEVVEPEPSLV